MQRKGSRNKTAGLSPGVGTRSVHAADATQGASRSRVVDRALAARDAARITGEYFTADEVLGELDDMHAKALTGPGK